MQIAPSESIAKRSLIEMINENNLILKQCGTTFKEIALIFQTLFEKVKELNAAPTEIARIGPCLIKRIKRLNEKNCPFPFCDEAEQKKPFDFRYVIQINKKTLVLSALKAHMICSHYHFDRFFVTLEEVTRFILPCKEAIYEDKGTLLKIEKAVFFNPSIPFFLIPEKLKSAEISLESKEEIDAKDALSLKHLDCSYYQIGNFLEIFSLRCSQIFQKEDFLKVAFIGEKYLVEKDPKSSYLRCVCEQVLDLKKYLVTDVKTKKQLNLYSVYGHAIKQHNKFPKGKLRITPEELVDFFELKTLRWLGQEDRCLLLKDVVQLNSCERYILSDKFR